MIERYYLKAKGMQGPTVAHDSLAEAYAEAARLKEKLGRTIYVLQVIGMLEVPVAPKPVDWPIAIAQMQRKAAKKTKLLQTEKA